MNKKWDGEEEDEWECGLEEVRSAICRHGKDQDGYMEEEHAGIFTDTQEHYIIL